jgi:hypothetical protein
MKRLRTRECQARNEIHKAINYFQTKAEAGCNPRTT